jgi:hypothetical protein
MSRDDIKKYKIEINGKDYIAVYIIPEDDLRIYQWNGITGARTSLLPLVIRLDGFADYCTENGLMERSGLYYDYVTENWVDSDYVISISELAQDYDVMKEAIIQFLSQEYADEFI